MPPITQPQYRPPIGTDVNRVPELWQAVVRNNLAIPRIPNVQYANPFPQTTQVAQTPATAATMRNNVLQQNQLNQWAIVNNPRNPSDVYSWYISQYEATNPETANLLKWLYNWYDAFSNNAKNITSIYDNFYNQVDPYYNNFARINQWLNKDIVGKLQEGLNTAYSQYWPQGSLTKMVGDYYTNLADNIAAQNAASIWNIQAQAMASWANQWAVRNAVNKANLDANTQYLNMKQKEIENYDNIYKNLNAYLDNFTSKYWNSQDKYVRDTYNQLVNYRTQIWNAYKDSLVWLEQSRLQYGLTPRGTWAWSGITPWGTWEQTKLPKYRWMATLPNDNILIMWRDWSQFQVTRPEYAQLVSVWDI